MSKHLDRDPVYAPQWWTLAVLAVVMTAGVIVTGVVIL